MPKVWHISYQREFKAGPIQQDITYNTFVIRMKYKSHLKLVKSSPYIPRPSDVICDMVGMWDVTWWRGV